MVGDVVWWDGKDEFGEIVSQTDFGVFGFGNEKDFHNIE